MTYHFPKKILGSHISLAGCSTMGERPVSDIHQLTGATDVEDLLLAFHINASKDYNTEVPYLICWQYCERQLKFYQ